jgi:hypothetical protein
LARLLASSYKAAAAVQQSMFLHVFKGRGREQRQQPQLPQLVLVGTPVGILLQLNAAAAVAAAGAKHVRAGTGK